MPREITALRLESHGAPLRLERVPLPDPGPDEGVVDMVGGGGNPGDRYGAEGRVAAEGPLPRTLGGEAAGYCDGKPVLVNGAGLGSMRDGVWAEAVTAPRSALTPLSPTAD